MLKQQRYMHDKFNYRVYVCMYVVCACVCAFAYSFVCIYNLAPFRLDLQCANGFVHFFVFSSAKPKHKNSIRIKVHRLLFRWNYVDMISLSLPLPLVAGALVLSPIRSFFCIFFSHKRKVGFRSGLISTHLQFSWTHRHSIVRYIAQLIWIYGTSLKDKMNVNLL